jgi:hypothetical protein
MERARLRAMFEQQLARERKKRQGNAFLLFMVVALFAALFLYVLFYH